ncbi:MAG: NUDIX domain-containing protein [Chitinispirillaceae bacterium]|nr:NUDIX domain-containing protein [Chitinispirillaceae bacterium]
MESVEILTADGKWTGRTVLRSIAHTKGLWHRTVHVWIRNRGGELLFQKRSSTKETFPCLWDISAAGHISAGDSSRGTAVREMREELGISIESNALRFLFTLRHYYISPDNSIKDNEITDVYLYTVPVEEEEVTPDPEEVSGVVYYSIITLKRLLSEKKELFVPHDEEYRRLFEVIDNKSPYVTQ